VEVRQGKEERGRDINGQGRRRARKESENEQGLRGVEPRRGSRASPGGFWCKNTSEHPAAARAGALYEDEVYLVTALVPSDTACLASSPGSARRTAVWISREVRVPFLL